MALADVAQLVRQHRSEFIGRAHHPHQAQVHAQIATRQREGVDHAVAPKKELKRKALVQFGRDFAARARRSNQRLPHVLHVFGQLGIVDVVRIAVQLPRDAVAQAPLRARAHVPAVAQRGQAGLTGLLRVSERAHYYQKNS